MSHRISQKRAMMLYEKELTNRGLQRKGIVVKFSRKEKKHRMRLSKVERFIERLKFRGGYYKQKEERKNE